MARGKQTGPSLSQMEPLGICTTFLSNKLQPKVENEDEDDYDWFPGLRQFRVIPSEARAERLGMVPGGRVELPTKGL